MPKKTKAGKLRDLGDVLDELGVPPLTFGAVIETIRETDDYTQASLAKKLGVSRANLCDIEKGRKGVSVMRAAEWARKLGYSVPQFVALALQAEVTAAGLKYSVEIKAA